MQNLRSHLAGQHVEARGEPWIVLRAEPYDACTIVTLRGTGEANLGRTTALIAPFDRLRAASSSRRPRRASRRSVLRAAAIAVARAHTWLEPWTAATAHIDLHDWQLEPAMAAVSGATRLLLSDGVGLGKTIQAGLVLTELRARALVRRALILTPASLREQWALELTDRFALDPMVLDHAALARLAAELPPQVNPWSVADIAISSIDLVKRGEVRRALDAIPLDLLIVDEAHHLRPGTDRGALVEDLAARVPWLVLATATPHSGDEPAYTFLRRLGAHSDRDEIATFRRTARLAAARHGRRVRFHAVRATDDERRLLDETMAYGRAIWAEHHALLAAVVCRRAVSSAAALLRTLERRRDLLAVSHQPATTVQSELPWEENDERDAVESDSLLDSARLPNAAHEAEWLNRLITLAEAAIAGSSKAAAVVRLLARTRESAIVFSEYRDTLAFLRCMLQNRFAIATIHGGLSARERRDAVQQFVSGRARVLLATDAAGEGLNLQHSCRLVVNVELPWTPLRLEQRIGRVDRIGQTRRVHSMQLVHHGSFEDVVLARFQKRLHTAGERLADTHCDERAVAAAVFTGTGIEHHSITAGGGVRQTTRVSDMASMQRRAVRALGPSPRTHSVYAVPTRRQRAARQLVTLFECDFHDRAGRLVAREILPLLVELNGGAWRAEIDRLATLLPTSDAIHTALDPFIAARCGFISTDVVSTSTALCERLRQIIAALEAATATPIQVSLFDKRAEQDARAHETAAAHIRDHLRRRLDAASALACIAAGAPRLVALWPLGR